MTNFNKIITKIGGDLSCLNQNSLNNFYFFLDKIDNALDIQEKNIIFLRMKILNQNDYIKHILIKNKILKNKNEVIKYRFKLLEEKNKEIKKRINPLI